MSVTEPHDGSGPPGPAALYGVRIETPRLELRLGDTGELRELATLAERGIHDPDEMPFAIAWTDAVGEPDFVDGFLSYHQTALRNWTAASWALHLLVWEHGTLVGTQSVMADRFSETLTVETGSWLGRAHQGRGLGTEMRAAVVELAIRGLGATAVTSAWLEGNEASRRVSEKLGYRLVGEVRREPRPGEPVRAWEVRLDAAEWHPPVAVALTGVTDCLPLFGLGSD